MSIGVRNKVTRSIEYLDIEARPSSLLLPLRQVLAMKSPLLADIFISTKVRHQRAFLLCR